MKKIYSTSLLLNFICSILVIYILFTYKFWFKKKWNTFKSNQVEYCEKNNDTLNYPKLGYRWVKLTCTAPFSPRDGQGSLLYKDSLWIIGGWNPDKKINPRITTNDVWKSKDGINWELVKNNSFIDDSFNNKNDWEGRHTAGYVVFNDKMWIIGGDLSQGHYQNDIWNTSDGVNWKLVGKNQDLFPRVLHYTLAFKNKIWVMGGQTIPGLRNDNISKDTFYSDVWNSSDGINWKKIPSRNEKWSPRGMIGGSVVFNDRMWVIGGGTYNTTKYPVRKLYNDVWSSDDGINWKCHTQQAEWEIRSYHDLAVWDEKIWVIAGSHSGQVYNKNNVNDVWYTDNGESWNELNDTPWSPRHASGVISTKDALYIIGGNNMESDVWKLEKY